MKTMMLQHLIPLCRDPCILSSSAAPFHRLGATPRRLEHNPIVSFQMTWKQHSRVDAPLLNVASTPPSLSSPIILDCSCHGLRTWTKRWRRSRTLAIDDRARKLLLDLEGGYAIWSCRCQVSFDRSRYSSRPQGNSDQSFLPLLIESCDCACERLFPVR